MEVRWVSCGSPMGVQLSLEGVVVVQWESAGSPLGVSWVSPGVSWVSAGSLLGVCWESAGSLLGIFKMVSLEVLSK